MASGNLDASIRQLGRASRLGLAVVLSGNMTMKRRYSLVCGSRQRPTEDGRARVGTCQGPGASMLRLQGVAATLANRVDASRARLGVHGDTRTVERQVGLCLRMLVPHQCAQSDAGSRGSHSLRLPSDWLFQGGLEAQATSSQHDNDGDAPVLDSQRAVWRVAHFNLHGHPG